MDIEFHSTGPAQRQSVVAILHTNYYELSGCHPKVRILPHDINEQMCYY
jgi:hypothetical protein